MFKVYYFKKLKSTNDKAKEFGDKSIVIAEVQTKGRGRFNRKWSSSKGGLWMSIVLKPKIKNPKRITFITAIVVQKTINRIFGVDTKIKWPNDVLFNGKKLCGVLTEAIFKNNKMYKMIVGIGLNVNNKLPLELRKKAISLKEIIHKNLNTKKLSNEIIKEFFAQYKKYEKNNSRLLIDWKRLSDTVGRNVKVKTIDGVYYGIAHNVDEDCNLVLRLKNNRIKKIIEGDVFY